MSDAPRATGIEVLVVGGGPAGIRAAIQAAKAGKRVVLVERDPGLGGECVHRGTIPSKTLRETAAYLSGLRRRSEGLFDVQLGADVKVASLTKRLRDVLDKHEQFLEAQIERNAIRHWHGLARFRSPEVVEVVRRDGSVVAVEPEVVVLATGSRPRTPDDVPVDHEHVLDSDSILSLIYLPRSLTVLGGGVIAAEFASLFAALGVEVTMVERRERPLGFMDPELTDRFVAAFEAHGGRFLGGVGLESVVVEPGSGVATTLDSGETLRAEKLLCALGRVASVKGLQLEKAGIELTSRGLIPVDDRLRTVAPHVYAVGDVIGPPALATTAMEQGRRAVRNALGIEHAGKDLDVPVGIYTIPELACVGETEAQVTERLGAAPLVGRARFEEVARAQINGHPEGFLKLVCDPAGRRVLGAHVVGEGATDLVHLAQLAIHAALDVDTFVENVFNFPTLTEAYRIAALDVVDQRALRERPGYEAA